jgi:hypothetical protein
LTQSPEAAAAREVRKVVTVFFFDVAGSKAGAGAEWKGHLVAEQRIRARLAEL